MLWVRGDQIFPTYEAQSLSGVSIWMTTLGCGFRIWMGILWMSNLVQKIETQHGASEPSKLRSRFWCCVCSMISDNWTFFDGCDYNQHQTMSEIFLWTIAMSWWFGLWLERSWKSNLTSVILTLCNGFELVSKIFWRLCYCFLGEWKFIANQWRVMNAIFMKTILW